MNEHLYNSKHLRNVEQVTKQVQRSYKDAINQIAELSKNTTLDKSGEFYFAHHKTLSKKVDGILENLFTEVSSTIVTGVNSSWQVAVDKNNEICHYLYGKGIKDLPDEYKAKYLSNNDEARQSFINRKEAGQLNWSERVWNLKGQFKQELELALETNLGKGNSAQYIAKEIKTYLNNPDKLFRRVRNEKGELRLSKNAKAYHPGQGVYRSSYRNALRLARNEINFSYEKSNHEKRQQQDFVVGVEVKVSKNHNPASDKGGVSCLSLQGMYPKDFDFTYKWHVNCLCQSYAILKTKGEVNDDLDKILDGQEPDGESVNKVTGLPNSFTSWVDKNKDMWKGWKNEPRFLTYNQGLLNKPVKFQELPFEPGTYRYNNFDIERFRNDKPFRQKIQKQYSQEYKLYQGIDREFLDFYINTGEDYKNIRRFISGRLDEIKIPQEHNKDTYIERLNSAIKNIQKLIKEHPLKENTKLTRMLPRGGRTISRLKELELGDIFDDISFSSTSIRPISTFGDFKLTIYADKGSQVMNIGNVTEMEYLIQSGSKYIILEKKENEIILKLLPYE